MASEHPVSLGGLSSMQMLGSVRAFANPALTDVFTFHWWEVDCASFCTPAKGKWSCYLVQKTGLSHLSRDLAGLVLPLCAPKPLLPSCHEVLRESWEGTQVHMALNIYICLFYR